MLAVEIRCALLLPQMCVIFGQFKGQIQCVSGNIIQMILAVENYIDRKLVKAC